MRGLAAVGLAALCLAGCDPESECAVQEGNPCGPTTAVVKYVVDGDTLRLASPDEYVRLIGVDTPELSSGSAQSKALGQIVKADLEQLVPPGTTVELEYEWEGDGSGSGGKARGCRDYTPGGGRLLAYVCVNGQMLNRRQLALGHGCCYVTEDKPRHRVALRDAEQSAQQTGAGVWAEVWTGDTDTCSTKYKSTNICRDGP